jgi:hypothetical protein
MKTKLFLCITIFTVLTLQVGAEVIKISSLEDLFKIGRQNSGYPLNGHYELTQDIDATSAPNLIFTPIGSFTGIFDGNGYIIKGLSINQFGDGVGHAGGLFRYVEEGGEVKNVGLEDFRVSSSYFVGGLVGELRGGTITNCYYTGFVNGDDYIGGLVGRMSSGIITGSYSANSNSSLTGVGGSVRAGGLVGVMSGGTVVNSYSNMNVSISLLTNDASSAGGLVGHFAGGQIINCYSTGPVSKRNIYDKGTLGGLIGTRTNHFFATVTNSYWNTETSGLTVSAGGEGLTTAEMIQQVTYTGWDFDDIWYINEGKDYPYLLAFGKPTSVSQRQNIKHKNSAKFRVTN